MPRTKISYRKLVEIKNKAIAPEVAELANHYGCKVSDAEQALNKLNPACWAVTTESGTIIGAMFFSLSLERIESEIDSITGTDFVYEEGITY
jgi:hypothetical protein